MIYKITALLILVLASASHGAAPTHCTVLPLSTANPTVVNNSSELETACNNPPASRLILLNPGDYTGDITCDFRTASAANPITIRSANANVNSWAVLKGDEDEDEGVWTISGHHYRITNIKVDEGGIALTGNFNRASHNWAFNGLRRGTNGSTNIRAYFWATGIENRIDHNTIGEEGTTNCNTNQNVTKRRALRILTNSNTKENRIDHNYIINMKCIDNNSEEAIQVGFGNSDTPRSPDTYLEYNYVKDYALIGGGAEVVSIKSGGTKIRYNRFNNIDNARFSLRTAHNTEIRGNVFEDFSSNRGVTASGPDTIVTENLFDDVNLSLDEGTELFSVMISQTTCNGDNCLSCYPAVENGLVTHNEGRNGAQMRFGFNPGSTCGPASHEPEFGTFNNQGFSTNTGNGYDPNQHDQLGSSPGTFGSWHRVVGPGEPGTTEVGHTAPNDRFCEGEPPTPPTSDAVVAKRPEPIHNNTTDPGALVVDAANCEPVIEAENGQGGTVLIRAGTCTVEELILRDISIYPFNGADVTIRSDSGAVIKTCSDTTVAGLLIDAKSANVAIGVDPDNCPEAVVDNVIIRNNDIQGGLGNSLIRIIDSVTNSTIIGNRINGGGGVNSDDGHGLLVSAGADNLMIEDNLFLKDVSLLNGWSSFGSLTGALLRVESSNQVEIKNNSFISTVPGSQAPVQLGPIVTNEQYWVHNNYWHGPTLVTTQACLAAGGGISDAAISHNIFDRCGAAGGSRGALQLGHVSTSDDIRGSITQNLIIAPNDTAEAMAFKDVNGLTVTHNTVVNGRMEFTDPGNLGSNTITILRNNIFQSVDWSGDDLSGVSITTCSHNNNNASDSMPSGCTSTTTTDPQMEDCTFEQFRCTPQNTTFLSQLGSDSQIRGAFIPPVVRTDAGFEPEMGDVNAQTLTLRFSAVPESDGSAGKAVRFSRSRFTLEYDSVAQTINTVSVTPLEFEILMTAQPDPTDVIELTTTTRWCYDESDFGHMDSALDDILGVTIPSVNAACGVLTDLPVTNGEGGGGNTIPNAVDDTASTPQSTLVDIDVLDNDTDADLDALVILSFDNLSVQGQTVILDDNGTPGTLTDDTLNYLPDSTFVGVDTFEYSISDGNGGIDTAVVTVTVTGTVSASGRFYVSGTLGDDTNTDTEIQNPATPAKTIARAVTTACSDGLGAGDEVVVMSGTYTEAVLISCSGDSSEDFIISAAPANQVVVDVQGVSLASGQAAFTLAPSSEFITVEGFIVRNAHLQGSDHSCFEVGSGQSNHITLFDLTLQNCGEFALDLSNGVVDMRIEQVRASGCLGAACIMVEDASRVDMVELNIHDNLGQASAGDYAGILVNDSLDIVIEDSVIERSCNGIVLQGTTGSANNPVTIRDNKIINLGGSSSCSTSVGLWARGSSDSIRFIGNQCNSTDCSLVSQQATRVSHVHESYAGSLLHRPAGCEGDAETSPGDEFRIHNSIFAPGTGQAWGQWNASFVSSWPVHFLGNNNLYDGDINFDINGRQNGVACPDTLNSYSDAAALETFKADTSLQSGSVFGDPFFKDIDQSQMDLLPTSPAIDAGECLMTVASSVTGQQTISINGMSPLELFIDRGKFFKRSSERVYIDTEAVSPASPEEEPGEGGEDGHVLTSATLESMTSSSITFTTEVSLDAGDCLSPRQLFEAPDIGAIERLRSSVPSAVRIGGFRVGGYK